MRLLRLTLASLCLLGTLGPSLARACSCVPEPPPAEAREAAAAVFAGRVVSAALDDEEDVYAATVRVASVWKGSPGERVTVKTDWRCCLCGLPLEVGQEYLLYLYAREGALWVGSCSRSRKWEQAAGDVRELGSPVEEYRLSRPLRSLGRH